MLGDHPQGGSVVVREGRYGPYLAIGKTNINISKDMNPEALTLSEALAIIEGKGGLPEVKAPAKKAAPKKAAAAKPAAKKPAVKKPKA